MGRGGRDTRERRGVVGRTSIALLLTGVLLLNLAVVAFWSWRTFASSQGFADVTTDMLKEPAVREVVAEQIADALEQQSTTAQLTVTARPVVEAVVADLVATDSFRGVFHGAVRELHTAIVEGRRSRLLVRVDDAAQIVKTSLQQVNPDLADSIPDAALEVAVGITHSTPIDTTMRWSSLAGWLTLPLLAGAAGCFVAAGRRAADRRRAIEALGLSLIATGVAHFALIAVGVNVAAGFGDDDRQRTALRAVFWSVTHLLNVQAKVVITIGTVMLVAGAYAGTGQVRSRLGALADAIRRRLGEPPWRALACILCIGVGLFAMRWPEATTSIVIRVGAFCAFVAGAIGLLDVLGSVHWAIEGSARVQRTARRLAFGVTAALAMVSVTLLFGGLALARAVRAPDVDHPSSQSAGCNGSIDLCDRRLDDVAFAGTHNSMAATSEEGWLVARHTGGVVAQLASGYRAFLLDLHYGGRIGGRVRTDLSIGSKLEELDRLTPAERAATERLLAFVEVPEEEREVYLCHIYCELGATPAVDTFRSIHDFLRENPNEVVLLLLEDDVSATDAMEALRRGGLAQRALEWRSGQPLPTLRELIETKRNVVVLAENGGGAAPWYLPAFELVQDTPYRFRAIEEFSCELNRGAPDNPLLLVNHWLNVDPPNPAAAAEANDADVLRARTAACRERRERMANIIAVDFYAEGDVLAMVAELNGVS